MKKKYAFHPNNYYIDTTENYYTEMASKGWELEERGIWLSKFKKSDSKEMLYRIAIMKPDEYELKNGTDEQVIAFEESGWKYVSGFGQIHVFSAPIDNCKNELYSTPEKHIKAIEKIRNYYLSNLINYILIQICSTIEYINLFDYSLLEWPYILFDIICILILLSLIWVIINHITAVIYLSKLRKKFKNGILPNQIQNTKRFPTQSIPVFAIISMIILLFVLFATT